MKYRLITASLLLAIACTNKLEMPVTEVSLGAGGCG